MMQHCHENIAGCIQIGERYAMSKSTQNLHMSEAIHSRLLRPSPMRMTIYLYLFMKSSWNLTIDPTHSVPGARNVVRKCRVPSF